MARLALFLFLLLAGASAQADPISLIATAIVQFGGLTGLPAFLVLAGSQLLSAADARRKQAAAAQQQRDQYNASLQDRSVTTLANDSPWQVVYGAPAPVGGSLVAMFSSGSKDEYKHLVIVFASHECMAIDEIYIEGDAVGSLDANGWTTAGAFYENAMDATVSELVQFTSGVGSISRVPSRMITAATSDEYANAVNYAVSNVGTVVTLPNNPTFSGPLTVSFTYATGTPRVNVQKHMSPGGVDVADVNLISWSGGRWTTAHKLSGYTYIVLTLDLRMSRFQGGPPNVTAKVRGKKIYDYRTSTTIYSSNPALCLADFLCSEAGFSAMPAQIDAAAAIVAANACDAQGFACNGIFNTDAGRDSTLKALEDSMAGRTHWSGGLWRILAGIWTTPVMTLDDANMAAPIEVSQAANVRASRFNGVRGKYLASAGLGVSTDFTPYTVASYVAADGTNQWQDVTYQFTGTNSECQKLAAIEVERSRAGLTINYPAHLTAWKLQPGDRVIVNNAELGFSGKTFRVQDWTHVNSAPLGLVLVEDTASMWTGTYSVADPLAPTSNLVDPYARPAAPTSLTAVSGTAQLLKNKDGTIVSRVYVTWPTSTVRAVLQGGTTQLQWRSAGTTVDQWINYDLASDASSMYIDSAQDNTNILIRVRYLTGVGSEGAWATIAHQVLGKTEPPGTPSLVSVSNGSVYWSPVYDLDLAGYVLRSIPGATPNWGAGTAMHAGVVTSIPFVMPSKLYGVQTIMVAARDTSGNLSAIASATFDFGLLSATNVVQSYDYRANTWPGTYTNCSVSGGDLVASVAGSSDIYVLPDVYSQSDVYASTYNTMQWVSQVFLPRYNGTVSLGVATAGTGVTIEYQYDASDSLDAYPLADDYASTDLYGSSSAWTAWPGALVVKRMQGLIFRVSITGGNTQGVVSAFTIYFSMNSTRQTFGLQNISIAGTRLSPTAGSPSYTSWLQIDTVQATVVADGGTAVGCKILEINPTLGPFLVLITEAGVVTSGRATIDIGGIVDV